MQGHIRVSVFPLVSHILSNSVGTAIKEHHPCPKTHGWDKKRRNLMGFGERDWQNGSFGLGRDENMMCGAGGVWEWELWKRLLALPGTSPSFGILLWGKKHFYHTVHAATQAMSALLVKESQALTCNFEDRCGSVTTYSHGLTLAPSGANWPRANCAGYITLNSGVPWDFHES